MSSKLKNRSVYACLIWALVFLLAAFTVKICLGRIWVETKPDKSQFWFKNYSITLFNLGSDALSAPDSLERHNYIVENAKLAMKKAPLSDVPFIQIGHSKVLQNDSYVDRDYFLIALSRNSRNRKALGMLLSADILQSNFSGAVEKLDVLMRLNGGDKDQYMNALSGVAKTEEGRAKINTLLKRRSFWAKDFVINQINNMNLTNDNEVASSLNSYSSDAFILTNDKFMHERYMRRLIEQKKYEKAYQHYIRLNEKVEFKEVWTPDMLFNSNFKKFDSPSPFNWLERKQEKFYSEISEEGYITVFNDEKPQMLTDQVLKLRGGESYTFQIDADWFYRKEQGMFVWSLRCLESGQLLLDFELGDKPLKPEGNRKLFDIPEAGCDWQRVSLIAKPGVIPHFIRAKTKSLAILPN